MVPIGDTVTAGDGITIGEHPGSMTITIPTIIIPTTIIPTTHGMATRRMAATPTVATALFQMPAAAMLSATFAAATLPQRPTEAPCAVVASTSTMEVAHLMAASAVAGPVWPQTAHEEHPLATAMAAMSSLPPERLRTPRAAT